MPSLRDVYFPRASRRAHHKDSKRSKGSCSCHVRRAYAQAEIFVEDKLYRGYSLGAIENIVQKEIDISRLTGELCPCYLHFCLRILRNLRGSHPFSCLPINRDFEIYQGTTMKDGVFEHNFSFRQDFRDKKVVQEYGMDQEMSSEIERSQALDQGTVIELRRLKDGLHAEAEKEYQSRKKHMLEGGPSSSISTQTSVSRESKAPQRLLKNGQAQSTYSQSSSGSTARPDHARDDEVRTAGRRRPESRENQRRSSPETESRRGRDNSSTISPTDSVSQIGHDRRIFKTYDSTRIGNNSQARPSNLSAAGDSHAPSPLNPRMEYRQEERTYRENRFYMGAIRAELPSFDNRAYKSDRSTATSSRSAKRDEAENSRHNRPRSEIERGSSAHNTGTGMSSYKTALEHFTLKPEVKASESRTRYPLNNPETSRRQPSSTSGQSQDSRYRPSYRSQAPSSILPAAESSNERRRRPSSAKKETASSIYPIREGREGREDGDRDSRYRYR
ncbi:uncharacterized protein L3040_008399 [Drepanopeziza brunnea f. sp. 'multigermtubi']|uniref:Uncharacterized protein n=1 Tax=Marssonina brunnea f. sp. multigermtubi (strain MB_m1) TaxID=1072389 RepID=K1WIA3_MARBU|nr:uncharacterized protein MBM_04221 [Drepanopeziza brunnea f. sp. 'multigermtubi' MB_m1]EKD17360.1 hypothetical protein MBM_04221 [Drepanopeziza brunnea f. sp. 'multigermtubi' MB_m1]KAJ5035141.1 hypothetical protein L3040_008399 [Drepanopeziza brunnea f. sp. 'multigermtubi']